MPRGLMAAVAGCHFRWNAWMRGSENRAAASGQGAPHQRRQEAGVKLEIGGRRVSSQDSQLIAQREYTSLRSRSVLCGASQGRKPAVGRMNEI
jgi:hypothetical protein